MILAYKPSYGWEFLPAGPIFQAIPVSSAVAGFIGTALTTVLYFGAFLAEKISQGTLVITLEGVFSFLLGLGLGITVGTIGGTFVVAWYIAIFGLPVALILRNRLRSGLGLALAMATAIAAAYFANVTLSFPGGPGWEPSVLVLCFAIPAGLIYRRNIIALSDELEVD